ncbi:MULTISPECIES: hypothetical protein [unclassified Microbulbifer]|uniref:hypothetical protein n=1 Tax=unclassified Microbulbifer TaxID=2619833 RepID=UPI0027E3FC72|nr:MULTISPECIES: hypothetical protein [unclassified Microbulbifer]
MNRDQYQTWIPVSNLAGKVIVERIVDSDDGLSIFIRTLDNEENRYRILFDPYVAYRNMDEGFRTKTFSEVGGFDSSLYLIANSSWLQWLHEESLGYYKDRDIKHYFIVTSADCLDVLSEFEPSVEVQL